MSTTTETPNSRLRAATSWLRQMRAALEFPAPEVENDRGERTRRLDQALNRLRAFGIDPRI